MSAPEGALWLGFAGLLSLMAAMALDATTSLRAVVRTTALLRSEARARDNTLDQLRAEIFRSSTLVRDYLLETDDAGAASYKRELEAIRDRVDAHLHAYSRAVPQSERDLFEDLRRRVGAYWGSLAPAMRWDAAIRRQRGANYLRDVIQPLRAGMVDLTRQITFLNDRDLDAAEDRIRTVQEHFGQRVILISVLALFLGLLLGAASLFRVRRLARESAARFAEVQEAHHELRNLSSRLVTAQEEERRRLARELHDEVGQSLSAMLVEMGRVETAPDAETRATRLAAARQMAEAGVGMVRNMALLLRPSMLDDLGLVAALRWQAREVNRRSGLKVKVDAPELEEDLPDEHRTCIYRLVQEALHNCARHAHANQVEVAVQRGPRGLSVTVQDDGVGFNPALEKGLGLLGMEERIQHLGGRLSIESAPGAGTTLAATIPLDHPPPTPREPS